MSNYVKITRHYTKRINQCDIWMAARNSGGLHKKIRLRVAIPKVRLLKAFGLIPVTVDLYMSGDNNHQFFITDSGDNGYSLLQASANKYAFWVTITEETEYFDHISHGEAYGYKFKDKQLWFKIKEVKND